MPIFSKTPTTLPHQAIGRRITLAGMGAAVFALLTGCSGTAALDKLVSHSTYRGTANVAYGTEPRQQLDIYQPLAGAAAPDAPVVLFFYGGNFTRGERADYRFVGEALAANGIIAVVADYRLNPQVNYSGILRDCALALKWTLSHAAELVGNPQKVFVMGHSAGAYNAAMLALDPRWLAEVGLAPNRLAGWIGLAGPYDFLPIRDTEVQVAFGWPNTPAESQPIHHTSAKAPRTLLLAGRHDSVVDPHRSTENLALKLRAAGTEVDAHVFDKLNHITTVAALARPLDWLAPVLPTVVAFTRGGPLPKLD